MYDICYFYYFIFFINSTAAQCLCDNSKENSTVKQEWSIIASRSAQNTVNPIRRIVDRCKLSPNPEKPLISLSIGKIKNIMNKIIAFV